MALFNFSSNVDSNKFYTTKYGAATISVDDNYVYSLASLGTTTDREAYVRFNIENLNIGDLITIEYDADGVGAISEQWRYIDPDNVEKTIETRSRNINGIYYGKSTFVAHKKGGFIISAGVSWGDNFEGIIENIAVSVKSNSAHTLGGNTDFQRFTITTASGGGVFELRDDWSRNKATLTELNDETLKLVPANKPNYRYQVFINLLYSIGSPNYIVQADVDEQNNVEIRFYDIATNEIVKLANVERYLYLGVLLV